MVVPPLWDFSSELRGEDGWGSEMQLPMKVSLELCQCREQTHFVCTWSDLLWNFLQSERKFAPEAPLWITRGNSPEQGRPSSLGWNKDLCVWHRHHRGKGLCSRSFGSNTLPKVCCLCSATWEIRTVPGAFRTLLKGNKATKWSLHLTAAIPSCQERRAVHHPFPCWGTCRFTAPRRQSVPEEMGSLARIRQWDTTGQCLLPCALLRLHLTGSRGKSIH